MKHLTKLLSVVSRPQVTVFMNQGKRKNAYCFPTQSTIKCIYLSELGARRGLAPPPSPPPLI